jgi:hypothetical protein
VHASFRIIELKARLLEFSGGNRMTKKWYVDNSCLVEPVEIEADSIEEVRHTLALMLIDEDGYHTEIFPSEIFGERDK